MQGFGTSERVFDDPHVFDNFNPDTARSLTVLTTAQQDEILDGLYRDLKLTWVRPATEGAVEPVNDNSDPEITDLSKFNFAWKRNDAHVEYVRRAIARGATNYFLSPVVRESWMGVTSLNDAAEYTEWSMVILRRWRELGLEPPYYSLSNEPGYNRNPMSGQFMLDVIKRMGPKLRTEGFRTKFVISDDLNPGEAYSRCSLILADPLARPYVGALATHLYNQPITTMSALKQLAGQYSLPLWMTEFTRGELSISALDYAEQILHPLIADYNVSVHLYLWGFFGQWSPAAFQLITLKYDGATYQGYQFDKMYYVLGQYSKYIPPGSVRIRADSSQNAVKVTAYSKDGAPVIVAINNTTDPISTRINLAGFNGISVLQRVRTSEVEDGASLSPVSMTGNGFSESLPAHSITTYFSTAATPLVVRNGASYEASPVSPGEIVSVFGSGLGPESGVIGPVDAGGRLSNSLAGTKLLFDGIPAPLLFVSAGQVNGIVPFEVIGTSSTRVTVEYQGLRAGEISVPVAPASAGLFSANGVGQGRGAILNQDASPNSPENPASQGSVVSVFATGGGQTDPPGENGKLSDAPLSLLSPVSVQIGGLEAAVLYAGAAPGFAGLVQINVSLPSGVTAGSAVPVQLRIGESRSQDGITISVL